MKVTKGAGPSFAVLKATLDRGTGLVPCFSGAGKVWPQNREPLSLATALAPHPPQRLWLPHVGDIVQTSHALYGSAERFWQATGASLTRDSSYRGCGFDLANPSKLAPE